MAKPDPQLVSRIAREKLDRAEQMSPLQRLLAGPELFDAFLVRHTAGLKYQHPEASEQQIRSMLIKRVAQVQAKDRPDEHP